MKVKNSSHYSLLERNAPKPWIWGVSIALVFVVLLNAWVSDDAYITFRTCFNLTHGYGPVYNLGERVQTFTNPLWMLLFSVLYALTGEAYFSSIALSATLLAGVIWLVHTRLFRGNWAGVIVVLALGFSLSFVEFSTSGLENVLNGFLFTLFISICWNQEKGRRKLIPACSVAALGMVSRMDTALLYLPAIVGMALQLRTWRVIGWLAIGLLPFILWEAFATFYYGFPFPNTAYAKLNSGIPQSQYWQHGWWYLENCLRRDPITLAGIALGMGACLHPSMRKQGALAVGIGLYTLYIMRIGGDFMAGRFLYLPFLGGLLLLGRALPRWQWAWLPMAIILVTGLTNLRNPWINGWRPQQPPRTMVDAHGIADERGWYHDAAALTALNDTMWALVNERILDTHPKDSLPRTVMFWDFLGYMGYGAGPQVHFCDRYALADPLLSRLPMSDLPDWRIGHFERVIPRGYRKTLRTGVNHIQDEQLCAYYDHLALVTRGPLWSWKRLETIWHFNLGHYDHLIDRDFYRNPSPLDISAQSLQRPHPQGEPFRRNGQIEIHNHRPLTIHLNGVPAFSRFEISLLSEADYILQFLNAGKLVGEMRLTQQWIGGGLAIYQLEVPETTAAVGFDAIRVEGIGGNEYYSIGHFRVGE